MTATPRLRSVFVAWAAPASDGGEPITGYTATASPGGISCTTTTMGCTVRNLTPGAAYAFTVVATNASGSSAPTAPVNAVPLDLPGAPTDVVMGVGTLTSSGIASVVKWKPPVSDGGTPLIRFTATANPGAIKCTVSTSVAAPHTSCRLSKLLRGVPYTVKVTARTIAGTGPASAPTAPLTFDVPAPPTAVRAVAGARAVRLYWSEPTSGNLPIKGYAAVSSPDGLTCQVLVPNRTCEITGLRAGVSYTFSVTARNALGTSAASVPSAPLATVPPRPGAVQQLTTATTFDANGVPTVRATWLAPVGAVSVTSVLSYLTGSTPPRSPSVGKRVPAQVVPALPGDTTTRYAATITGAAVKSPLAISAFVIGATKSSSTPVSVVLVAPSVVAPRLRPASAGRAVILRWQLTTAAGVPIRGLPVTVLVRGVGGKSWQPRALVSDRGGWVSFRRAYNSHTEVTLRYAGDATRLGIATPVIVQRVASALSANLSAASVRPRGVVRLTGVVLPGKRLQPVYLQVLAGRVWRSVAVTRTDARGRYTLAVPTSVRGVRRYRTYVRGTLTNLAGASGQRVLSVV